MSPTIGIFDSGVGGLSVAGMIFERIPSARLIYLSDNANFPYGPKDADQVTECVHEATSRLLAQHAMDCLVIACNTASTVALPKLRSILPVPVVGVVPAIKPAAERSQTKVIGLLATPGTIARDYTNELIQSFAATCRVLRVGSTVLVHAAEAKLRGAAVDLGAIKGELAPFFRDGTDDPVGRLDAIVLGCTHFPLLLDELTSSAGWPVTWLDSGDAVARRVRIILGLDEKTLDVVSPGTEHLALFTKDDPGVQSLIPHLSRRGFRRVAFI